MAKKWVHFDKHQGHRMKKRYTDKQRASYWKAKYYVMKGAYDACRADLRKK
jgi:hypothetical protein